MTTIHRELSSRLLIASLFLASVSMATAKEGAVPPEKYEIKLVRIAGTTPEYIFVIGESGFRTVASLKEFLGSRPKGTEITWAPGCVREGKEPLLSSDEEMDAFREFLEKKGLQFNLIPSG